MIDSLMNIEPDSAPLPSGADAANARRLQFVQANASLALEGLDVDAGDLEIQDRIARGLLTPDEAVAVYLDLARGAKP